MSLAELQHMFAEALLDPESPAVALEKLITGPPPLKPRQRVEIYRGSTLGALSRTLEKIFPVCRRIVGDACFGGLSRLYILRTPPREHDLSAYGEGFPAFLEEWMSGRPQWSDFAYLRDLARLEHLHHAAWRAADDTAFDFPAFEAAARTAAEVIRFTVPASLGLLTSPFPVDEVWAVNQVTEAPETIRADKGYIHLAVLRRYDQVHHLRLTAAQYLVLEAARTGTPLDELAELKLNSSEQSNETLCQLITLGLITGFHRPGAGG